MGSCLLAMPVPNGDGRRAGILQLPVSSMKPVTPYKVFKVAQKDEDCRVIKVAWPPMGAGFKAMSFGCGFFTFNKLDMVSG